MKLIGVLINVLLLSITACGVGSVAGDLSVNDLSVTDSSISESDIRGTGVVTLNWTPPLENEDNSSLTDLDGYKIYYGIDPDQLVFFKDIGSNLSSYLIENDQRLQIETTYYFGIKAYNSDKVESAMSNIVHKQL